MLIAGRPSINLGRELLSKVSQGFLLFEFVARDPCRLEC